MSEKRPGRLFRISVIILLVAIFLELAAIVGVLKGDYDGDGEIAVVELKGPIESSHETVAALKKYDKNDKVKAIVLRVDSPGGTVGASQEIHDEVVRIAKKKKVVVSMGDVAASGGYYIAAPATKIVANTGKITGSIGVISHHFVVEELLKKIYLRWEVIQSGKLKDIGSPFRNLTEEERKLLQALTDDMHLQFMEAVSSGRKMPMDKVRLIADGRVFTGKQAKAAGLVDELGGLEYAIRLAGKLAGLPEDAKPIYPEEKHFSWLRQLAEGKLETPALKTEYRMLP